MRDKASLLTPAQLCHRLKISPDQIKRLLSKGWLETALTVQMRNGEMRLFERSKVEALVPQMPKIRRAWIAEDNHRYGGCIAARRREEDRQQAEELKTRKVKFLSSLPDYPEPYDQLLRTCFYLYHLNHYAKLGEPYLYDIKEQVLRLLSRMEELVGSSIKIYFVPGSERVRLCGRCQERADRLHKSRPEYIRLYGGCSQCSRDENYYSLYEFIVSYDNYRFCFHVPYIAARKWFKNQIPPSKEGRAEREGFTSFGRSIFAAEAQAVELLEVVNELEGFILSFDTAAEEREQREALN